MSIQGNEPGLSRGFLEAIYCLYPTKEKGRPPTGSIATRMMACCGPGQFTTKMGWFAEGAAGASAAILSKDDAPVGSGWYRERSAQDRRAVRVRSRHYLTALGERNLLTGLDPLQPTVHLTGQLPFCPIQAHMADEDKRTPVLKSQPEPERGVT